MKNDTFTLGGKEFSSRFILGSGKYSMELIKAAVENAGAQIITLAVRRTNTKKKENILDFIPDNVTLLPNTSGARDAKEAVRIARMARELGCGDFVKVEIMKDSKYLLPDNVETVKATEMLAKEGFVVLPYMYPDLYTARDLVNAGAAAVMPLASPIGSNKGLATKEFIQILIDEIDLPVIVDAGIGRPSQACEAMEMGAAAVMANTAIATAGDVPAMAGAFKAAIEAGRSAYLSGLGRVLERGASASDPLTGFLRDEGGEIMAENQFFIDSDKLSEAALERKHKLETDPSSRTNHMEYMPGMEQIDPTIRNKVLSEMDSYDYNKYTARDVQNALEHETCSVEDFKALLSPAAEPFLERMAQRAKIETGKHFGNTVYLFTPLYIANYCENYCVYCGFNCYNDIHRKKLTFEEIEHEMKVIADSGIEEILMLTGESRAQSDVEYIGEACRLAKKYFRNIGLEIYPVNSDEYRYLHECGADYVTVFQETYDNVKYETLHLMGHKRVFPYRFEAQERALMGGMRGVGFSALLGLSDFHKDALASALHIYYLQRKYPYAEYSLSCPRLRPIINNDKINPLDVHEKQLCQILCAYRIFLPYVGITVSSREQKHFRDGIVKIAATKVSAGVSTGIGDHESKYTGKDSGESGDEQFEISDGRSFDQMYNDMESEGLQPVLNDYVYV